MHPINELRLLADIPIDVKLEKSVNQKPTKLKEAMGVSEVEPIARASEQTSTVSDNYSDGDLILHNNGVYIVVMSDPKTDMIGIIPAGLINASAAEKNRSVEMVKPDSEKCRKPTREEIDAFKKSQSELAAVDDDMDISVGGEGGTTNEFESVDMKKEMGKKKKVKVKKGEEECEMTESKTTLGQRIKEKRLKESTLNYRGNTVSHKETERDPINVVSQDNKSWANSLDPKLVKNEYTLQVNNRGKDSMTEENEKVKVPSKIKEALKQAIKEFKTDADKQGNGHTAQENAQLMLDTAEAFQKILDYLQKGTVMDIKHAQIFATTLMGPMLHKIPDNVWDFITNGGAKHTLKDYMIKVK